MSIRGIAQGSVLVLLGLASCNFDAAFKRYCDNNPRCQADAGFAPEVGLETGLETGPEAGLEVARGSEVNDVEPPWSIPLPKACTVPNDCSGTNEICHPISQVCVKTCNVPTDCPAWLGSCSDSRGGPTRGPKVCSCTAASCNSYKGYVCDSDGSCKPICVSDQDCLGFPLQRTCDGTTGFCKPISQPCSVSADCPLMQPRCDPTSLVCSSCLSSADCAGRSDGGLGQCGSAGGCVGPQSGP